jgi:hypothetical protein
MENMTYTAEQESSRELQVASYDDYRALMDDASGMMRIGINNPDLYAAAIDSSSTSYIDIEGTRIPAVIDVASQENESDIAMRQAVVSLSMLPEELAEGTIVTEQFLLSEDEIEQLNYSGKDSSKRITEETVMSIVQGGTKGELLHGHGDAQLTVLSQYDISDCGDMIKAAPEDVATPYGQTITTDRQKIIDHLSELATLHEDVFKEQAVRIGYFDGLRDGLFEELVNDPNFISVAAFDNESGEALMFALFARNIDGADGMPWVNKDRVQKMIDESGTEQDPVVAMPLVITSRLEGLGLFTPTTQLAMHEVLYRSQTPNTHAYIQYSANLESALYTPRIIDKGLTDKGARRTKCTVEVSAETVYSTANE